VIFSVHFRAKVRVNMQLSPKAVVRFVAAFLLVVISLLRGPLARAASTAYEPFDYTPGTLLENQAGGSGFATPWLDGGFNASIHNNYVVNGPGSLAFSTLATSGNHVSSDAVNAIAGLTRGFLAPLGADNTTAYLSVLLRPEGTLNDGVFNGFFGLYLNGSLGNDLFIGKPGADAIDRYVVENRGGANQVASGVAPVVGTTALLVLRADFLAGADIFTLYVNPTPGGPEPAGGAVKTDLDLGAVPGITIYSTGAFSIDEIRVGTTFADVTPAAAAPVPLPASLTAGLVLLAGMLWARQRRQRRAMAA
jgi:hypothetical protein